MLGSPLCSAQKIEPLCFFLSDGSVPAPRAAWLNGTNDADHVRGVPEPPRGTSRDASKHGDAPVPWLLMTTAARGTSAPLGSLTAPAIAPVLAVWPCMLTEQYWALSPRSSVTPFSLNRLRRLCGGC